MLDMLRVALHEQLQHQHVHVDLQLLDRLAMGVSVHEFVTLETHSAMRDGVVDDGTAETPIVLVSGSGPDIFDEPDEAILLEAEPGSGGEALDGVSLERWYVVVLADALRIKVVEEIAVDILELLERLMT